MKETILKLENVTKVYPNGTVANRDINMEFEKGEIHSIVGENGAGKSTLMKVIFGIERPSSGTVTYKGEETHFNSSMDAIKAGIGMVHQHFMLIPSFSIVDNIILGDEPKKNIFIDNKEATRRCQELSDKYDFELDVNAKVSTLSVAKRQKVEILKTLYRNAELIILDEPTSVLTPQETEKLFTQLRSFKEQGHTIIFISHKLEEVKQISDKISVIRNGVSKGTYLNEELTMEQLTNLIIGRDLDNDMDEYKTHEDFHNEKALEVRDLYMAWALPVSKATVSSSWSSVSPVWKKQPIAVRSISVASGSIISISRAEEMPAWPTFRKTEWAMALPVNCRFPTT